MAEVDQALLSDLWASFKDYQTVCLATVDGAQPRVRPVTLARLEGRFWVLTGTGNAKVQQLKGNSRFEFCLLLKDEHDQQGYVRAQGMANIITDMGIKRRLANRCAYFGRYWHGPNDPTFTLLALELEGFELLKPGELKARKSRLPVDN